jgi:hypothetical protein
VYPATRTYTFSEILTPDAGSRVVRVQVIAPDRQGTRGVPGAGARQDPAAPSPAPRGRCVASRPDQTGRLCGLAKSAAGGERAHECLRRLIGRQPSP